MIFVTRIVAFGLGEYRKIFSTLPLFGWRLHGRAIPQMRASKRVQTEVHPFGGRSHCGRRFSLRRQGCW